VERTQVWSEGEIGVGVGCVFVISKTFRKKMISD
jgi:hypothetical protein